MACILRVRSSLYFFSSTQYIVWIRRVQGTGREVGVFLKELKENSSTNLVEEGGYFNLSLLSIVVVAAVRAWIIKIWHLDKWK